MSGKKDKLRKKMREKERRLQQELSRSSLIAGVVAEQQSTFSKSKIPDSATVISENVQDGEMYSVSFSHYIQGECELKMMVENKHRDPGYALIILKNLGLFHNNLPKMQNELGYTAKKIFNSGEYQKLYNKLSRIGVDIKDTIIYEAYIKNECDGRMFFWIYPSKQTIYVLAIRKNHYKI